MAPARFARALSITITKSSSAIRAADAPKGSSAAMMASPKSIMAAPAGSAKI